MNFTTDYNYHLDDLSQQILNYKDDSFKFLQKDCTIYIYTENKI